MTTQDALIVGTELQDGAFVIQQVLGQGGFAITYLVHEVRLDRLVAVKELFHTGCQRQDKNVQFPSDLSATALASAKQKFMGEARILAKLRHRNIVEVYTSFEENNTAYMVMEFLQGETLREIVEEEKHSKKLRDPSGLPEEKVLFYADQIAAALKVVHEANYIHRDVKPENIVVCSDGRAVLLDFGLNKQLASPGTLGTMQLTVGLRFGSPGYSPPEQYGQQNRFGTYTDIYALGATLYYLLTGTVPEEAPERMYGGELADVRRLNRQVSPAVNDAVMWALELKGDQRPQTVDAFLEALRKGQPVASATPAKAALNNKSSNGKASTDKAADSKASKVAASPIAGWRKPSQLSTTAPPAPEPDPVVTPSVAPPQAFVPPQSSAPPVVSPAPTVVGGQSHRNRGALGNAAYRVYNHFKTGFIEILPRLLVIAAIIIFLIFASKWQKDQTTRQTGKKGTASALKSKSSAKPYRPRKQ